MAHQLGHRTEPGEPSGHRRPASDPGEMPVGDWARDAMLGREPTAGSLFSWPTGPLDSVQPHSARLPEDDWTFAMLVSRDPGETA